MKILIAEDDEVQQLVMKTIFEQLDVDFKIVGDGNVALNEILCHSYDIALIDSILPSLTADEIVEELNKSEDQDLPRIVIVSGKSDPNFVKKMIDLGVDEFIQKPIRLENIQEILNQE